MTSLIANGHRMVILIYLTWPRISPIT